MEIQPIQGETNANWLELSLEHNLDSDGSCIEAGKNNDITAEEIDIAPLADNGGNSLTNELLPGSPAIDAGNCAGGLIVEDQRGVSRPQHTACDIGAYEATLLKAYLPVVVSMSE